jgi:hypothetical protein
MVIFLFPIDAGSRLEYVSLEKVGVSFDGRTACRHFPIATITHSFQISSPTDFPLH